MRNKKVNQRFSCFLFPFRKNKKGFLGIDVSVNMVILIVIIIIALAVIGYVFWPKLIELKNFINFRW